MRSPGAEIEGDVGCRCQVQDAFVNSSVTISSDESLRQLVPSPPSQPYCPTGRGRIPAAGHDADAEGPAARVVKSPGKKSALSCSGAAASSIGDGRTAQNATTDRRCAVPAAHGV
jgi:hypothetical protein